MSYSKDDAMKFVEENDVRFLRLQFVDLFGRMKNVAITAKRLQQALDNGVMFDASSIAGFSSVEASDMFLVPDLDTISIMPWRPQQGKVARIICDIRRPDGTMFEGYPRSILRKVVDRAAAKGLTFNVGPECEFFLFHTDAEGNATAKTHDTAGYFDLAPIDLGENCRREICMVLEDMGFAIEASHHENAGGQHEIDFEYDDALSSADNIMTFKTVVKIVAQRNGLHATFMPKPLNNVSGSGMHINMSLYTDGRNLFNPGDGKAGISEIAKSFAAGVLAHMKGISAVANPLVNSYKRLVPGFEAPVHIAWSYMNRSPLMRVPATSGEAVRLELRSPDSACNPYLTLALILAAGLEGLEKNMKIAPPVDMNTYNLTPQEEKELKLEKLPANLWQALVEMKKDSLIREVLGEHVYTKYIEAKEKEWQSYDNFVHTWEVEKYLAEY